MMRLMNLHRSSYSFSARCCSQRLVLQQGLVKNGRPGSAGNSSTTTATMRRYDSSTRILQQQQQQLQQQKQLSCRRFMATLLDDMNTDDASCTSAATTATSSFNHSNATPPSDSAMSSHLRGIASCTTGGLCNSILIPSESRPLGDPLPLDEHACSVSLPTWDAVVGYEEGNASITEAMRCGYPRFVYHPYILQLSDTLLERYSTNKDREDCLVLPTAAAARRCQVFLQQATENEKHTPDNAFLEHYEVDASDDNNGSSSSSKIRVVSIPGMDDVYGVFFPAETQAAREAKAYWQHGGEVVSSRRAQIALMKLGVCVYQQERQVTDGIYVHHPAHIVHQHNEQKHQENNSSSKNNNSNNVSACNVEQLLQENENTKSTSSSNQYEMRQRISNWARLDSPEHVFLTPSGMSSIYVALRSARRYQMLNDGTYDGSGGGTSIVFGFPYLDTLKLCSRKEFSPNGVEFFGRGDANDLENLERLLERTAASASSSSKKKSYSAIFTEVPSNPLLHCPDLVRLRALADKYNFILVVDDTISNILNTDLLHTGLADVVCSSLTKLVSGRGDVMAGSVICNPYTPKGRWMQEDLQQNAFLHDPKWNGLYGSDAAALLKNSEDFEERNTIINTTTESLADWFHHEQEDIQRVYYPKFSPTSQNYEQLSSSISGGYGGLMSIVLDAHVCQRKFYDALNVAKGPSLGTNFTLVCPYTLLAHYHELDFAMQYNVPPNLIRIAVGMEPFDELQEKFSKALRASRLHPKLILPATKASTTAAATS